MAVRRSNRVRHHKRKIVRVPETRRENRVSGRERRETARGVQTESVYYLEAGARTLRVLQRLNVLVFHSLPRSVTPSVPCSE